MPNLTAVDKSRDEFPRPLTGSEVLTTGDLAKHGVLDRATKLRVGLGRRERPLRARLHHFVHARQQRVSRRV